MHEVAVLALPSVVAVVLGLPHKLIGGADDEAGQPLYRVRVATVDGGPVRTSAGYSVLPEHDASILRTADTVWCRASSAGRRWNAAGGRTPSARRSTGSAPG